MHFPIVSSSTFQIFSDEIHLRKAGIRQPRNNQITATPSQGRIEKAERDPLFVHECRRRFTRDGCQGIHFRENSSRGNVLDTEPSLPADLSRRLFCSSSVSSKLQELEFARKWQLAAISCESSCTKFQTKP